MIRLIKPYISFDEVEKEFKDVFETGWFTKGRYVEKFRQEIKNYTHSNYAFLTTSATTALWTCLKVLEIQQGDEVVVSDFSFPATANVVEDIGAIPIFADVNLATYNMLHEELEKKISSKTKAVIYVDTFGNPSGIHTIKMICRAHSLPLIEDAACAIGSSENALRCGNIADLTCFSFHPRKLLTTGEGGAITTNNHEFAKKLEIKLNHGASIDEGKFDFIDFGYNFRLPELQAVMGIKQLQKIDNIVKERNKIRSQYKTDLEKLDFKAQFISDQVVHNIQSLVFTVPNNINRDTLILKLKENQIETTLGTYCLSNCPYYKNKYKQVQKNAKFLEENTITLPCYQDIDFSYIIDIIQDQCSKM